LNPNPNPNPSPNPTFSTLSKSYSNCRLYTQAELGLTLLHKAVLQRDLALPDSGTVWGKKTTLKESPKGNPTKDSKGAFTPTLFGSVESHQNLFSPLVQFVWAGVKAAIEPWCAPKVHQTSGPRPAERGGLGAVPNAL